MSYIHLKVFNRRDRAKPLNQRPVGALEGLVKRSIDTELYLSYATHLPREFLNACGIRIPNSNWLSCEAISQHALSSNIWQQPRRECPNLPRSMLVERGPRPPRILVPLQRIQILVEARLDSIRRDAELIRRVTAVSHELRSRCCRDGAGGLESFDLCNDQGFHLGVGDGGGGPDFQVFETGD